MLTPEDIKNISNVLKADLQDTFVTKSDISEIKADLSEVKTDIIEMKSDTKEIKASINTLTMAVDSFSKEIKDNRTERLVVSH